MLMESDGLPCHQQAMRRARPCGEQQQAPVGRWIPGGEDEENPERGVHDEDHVEVVSTLHAPFPSRRPDHVKGIGSQTHQACEDEKWRKKPLLEA